MSYRVITVLKEGKPVYLLADGDKLEILPSKYLKYRTAIHLSPNTVRLDAYSLSCYYEYLRQKELDIKKIPDLKFMDQKEHFSDFLHWVKRGVNTGKGLPTKNRTCNKYLRNVFSYYRFLEAEEEIRPIKAITMKESSYLNSMGIRRSVKVNSYRGFLTDED